MGSFKRLAPLAVALFALALPATALANQTLTVEKTGTGTGKVTSSPAGISCDPTCSFAFADNTIVLLSGASGANTAPVAWAGCDSVTIEHKCKVTMSGTRTVKASFDLAKRKLSITKSGTGTGTVTSTPAGIDCGSACSAEYEHGTEVTLTGTSGPNTEAVKWSGCTSVSEGKCLVSMIAAKAVSATFSLRKQELKVTAKGSGTGTVTSSPSGINCPSTCSFLFGEGQTITLTGTPSGETHAVKWAGCDSLTAEGKCLVAMSGLREATAIFNLPSFTLTLTEQGSGAGTVTSSPAGIECAAASCSEDFVKGSTVTLTGTAGLHSEAVKWAGCDSVTIENKCLVAMSAARSVIASFDLEPQYIQYSVSVRLKGTGKGTVTSVPGGIECGSDCTETYVNRTNLTLIATPEPGSVFDHWSGGSCAGSGPCEHKINSSRLVNAVFLAVGKRTLSISKAGNGQGTVQSNLAGIECGASCSAEYEAGTKVTLNATPSASSAFAGWSGEGCSGTGACKLMLSEARNVTATFVANPAPSAAKCLVPRLAGKTLAKARKALSAAHCSVGKVRKPRGARLSELRVRSSSPSAGAVLAAGAKVALRLGRPRG
jgi:hypothetical protein